MAEHRKNGARKVARKVLARDAHNEFTCNTEELHDSAEYPERLCHAISLLHSRYLRNPEAWANARPLLSEGACEIALCDFEEWLRQ